MPPARIPLVGILIIPRKTTFVGDPPFITNENYEFAVGKNVPGLRKKGIFFISTPAIREAIVGQRIPLGKKVGHFQYHINHQFKQIALNMDYPTDYARGLNKLGIGSMAENILEKKYAKQYPKYHATSTYDDNPLRRRQYEKRGWPIGRSPTIQEARELTRKYVVQKHKEWMAKNPRPRRRPQ